MIKNEILKRNVPELLNGVDTKEKWEEKREEIKSLILKEEYGFLPEKIQPTITVERQWISFADKASWDSVFFTFEKNGKSHTVRCELILPKEKKKTDTFLFIDFESKVPSKYNPTEEILDGGFGIMSFCYQDVTTDDGDFTNGLCGLFCDENGKCSFGKISAWAYMASVCMDYLETLDCVGRVAIAGHSRLGKTALLASALDDRFYLTCVNNSGCCGASVSRGKTEENESIKKITDVFPFWFCENFFKYRDNERALPFDQHTLLSLLAPRDVVIGGAILDVWADNEGQFLSCYLASDAWELYGKKGFICGDGLPQVGDEYLDGSVGFYLRGGAHFMSRYDWNMYMKKFSEMVNKE